MASGLSRDRVLAIRDAPINDPRVLEALRKAAGDSDGSVSVAAWARLAESPSTHADAMRGLSARARGADEATAVAARHALARAGDRSAVLIVSQELKSPDADTRLAAGRVLVDAGATERAADLLADPSARVRMSTACAILNSRAD
jgi:HEAT repeat protein